VLVTDTRGDPVVGPDGDTEGESDDVTDEKNDAVPDTAAVCVPVDGGLVDGDADDVLL